MAQAAAITINDGAATPVATTFSPETVTPALSSFAERSSGISLAYRRIKISNTFASGKSVTNRAKLTIELPVTSVVNGITTVAHTLRANIDFSLPEGCSDASRKDLMAFTKNALAHALIQGAMRDLDPLY
jgi:hypothetical protein